MIYQRNVDNSTQTTYCALNYEGNVLRVFYNTKSPHSYCALWFHFIDVKIYNKFIEVYIIMYLTVEQINEKFFTFSYQLIKLEHFMNVQNITNAHIPRVVDIYALSYLFCRVRLIFQADTGLPCKKSIFRLPHLSQENPIIKQSKLSM